MENQSLLLMPDISGFTDFVKQTEVTHSQHIISELLELLIDANDLELTISEIEGDAILFYKFEDIPTTSQILEQTKKMFLVFHNHLRLYDLRRVCQCGACSTASSLTLKIIIHSGNIGFINVKDHKKPHGSEVILIHQLLKNNIDEKEYLLFTKNFNVTKQDVEKFNEHLILCEGFTDYEKFGTVNYDYIPLSPLQSLVIDPEPIKLQTKMTKPIVWQGIIDRKTQDVFEIISNLDLRLLWNKGVDELDYKPKRVNRVGTVHTCLINGKNLEFETVTNNFGSDKLVYGERLTSLPIVKEFSIYYILESKGEMTLLNIEVHYIPLPVIGWIFVPLFKKTFYKNLEIAFNAIKETCENNTK